MKINNCFSFAKKIFYNIKSFVEEEFFASLIVALILSFSILYLLKKINLLDLTSATKAISILIAIASILASIIAIIISISLVSFELQRKTYGSFVFRRFFRNLSFQFLLWSFMPAIIFTIIVSISIGTELSNINLVLFKISLFLFIFCLLILPFSIREILRLAEPQRKIKETINELIKNFKKFKESDFSDPNQEYETQISELQEMFSIALKANDKETINLILSEFTKKTKELLKEQSNEELLSKEQSKVISDYLKYILDLFKYYTEESFRQKDEFVLKEILKYLKDLKEFVQYKLEFPVIELNLLIRDVLWKATKEDFVSVCETGFYMLEESLEEDLKNHPFFKSNGFDKSEL